MEQIEELPPKMNIIIKKYFLLAKRHKKIAAELSSTEMAVRMQKKAMKTIKTKACHGWVGVFTLSIGEICCMHQQCNLFTRLVKGMQVCSLELRPDLFEHCYILQGIQRL
jgi:hypothetical protein